MSLSTTKTYIAVTMALIALFGPASFGQPLGEYLGRPVEVDGSDEQRLIICVNTIAGETRMMVVSRDDEGRWRVDAQHNGTARAAAQTAGLLYIFADNSYTSYNDAGEWVRTLEWSHDWPVTAAAGGESLWAFGGKIHIDQQPDPKPEGEAEPAAGKTLWRIGAAELRGDKWVEPADAPEFEHLCDNIRAARLNGVPYVFWRGRQAGLAKAVPDTIYYAMIGPEGWSKPATLEGVANTTKLGLTGGDELTLWMQDARHGISDEHPVTYRTFDGTRWSDAKTVEGVSDPRTDRTLYLMGTRLDGRAVPVLTSRQVVRIIPYDAEKDAWGDAVAVYSLPFTMRIEALLALGLALGAMLIAVGVSVWRHRVQMPFIETPEGPLAVADWRLRSAAAVIDLSLLILLFTIWTALTTDEEPGIIEVLVSLHVLSLPYFAVAGISLGQTPGKRMAGIMVVSRDGGEPAVWQILVRTIFRLVDTCLMAPVGILFILNTRGSQRLGDLLARTMVIRQPRAGAADDESDPTSDA